jgi:hypothetical protein
VGVGAPQLFKKNNPKTQNNPKKHNNNKPKTIRVKFYLKIGHKN